MGRKPCAHTPRLFDLTSLRFCDKHKLYGKALRGNGMKPGKREILFSLAVLLPVFMIIAGCGGGGGKAGSTSTPAQPTTISGVAAAGWPLTGNVTIKDSRGATSSTTIGVSGQYTIDVTGMTAPFVLMADGTIAGVSTQLFSGATQADIGGNINITPLTDLIISNVAGEISANLYSSGNFSNLTADNLNAQQVKLQAVLQPILSGAGVSSGTDLLRTFFQTNNTGLDAVIDLLTVTVNSSTNSATITNVTNQQTVDVNFATQTYTNSFSNASATAQSVSDITSIINFFSTLSGLFATSIPSATNPTLLNLFNAATFLNNGQNLSIFLSALTSNSTNIGLTLNGLSILALNPVAGTAAVNFTTNKSGTTQTMHFILVNGSWLAEGNLNTNTSGSSTNLKERES